MYVAAVNGSHHINAASYVFWHGRGSILMSHHLRRLGHLDHMEAERMPKQLLFGEMLQKRPRHGPGKGGEM